MQTQIMSTISTSIISYIWQTNASKRKNIGTLLDPISTAVAISLLNHYPDGTKISIQNNQINFQEPGTIQSINRWKNGDKYEDLANLINPIKKILDKKNEPDLWGDDNKNFIFLCHSMQSGLSKLADTYTGNNIAKHTVEYYKALIGDNLQSKTHFLEKIDTSGNYDIYQEFFEDWTKEQINVLVMLLDNIGLEMKKEIKDSYKQSIHMIIDGHNLRIKSIIDKVQSGEV